MNTLNHATTIIPNPHIAYTAMDDDIILMGPEDGRFYGINPIGAVIWNFISTTTCNIQLICEHIMSHYDISEAQCQADVNHFLAQMQKQGFISLE